MKNPQPAIDATITIATPEGVILSAPIASILRRMWAVMIDLIIISFGLIAIFVAVISSDTKIVAGLGLVFAFILIWGYFFLSEHFFAGKTIGKRILRIRVVSENLTPLTLQAALWRNILRYIDFLPTCFGVGTFFILFSPKHQRLGDWMAGTVVIYEEKILNKPRPLRATPAPLPWTLNYTEKKALLAFARYAEKYSLERCEEMVIPFHALLPNMNHAERVEKLCAFAAWIEQGGRRL